ncbi:MAG: hydrogenase iron-sulfur subunit [Rhodospirillales bacterium]|nr:hydrogenase iron-sulfur subunit [Rhodospirillales bacterium]
MLNAIHYPIRRLFEGLESVFDGPFGPAWNPIRQLGTLAFFFFWIAAVSGIYLFIFFDTSLSGAYDSIAYLTREQWYLGGIMRSLHRYSSDAMVACMILHCLREFSMDRYRGARWFTWFTGVPLIWLLLISGISGYWLVWDELAQYVAIGSMEWLDWLGIFGQSVAENFLTRGSLDDRFFSLLVFMHIFAPLFLLFVMWVHILRVSRAKTNPPRGLAIGSFLMLLALSIAVPAVSHAPADLGRVPATLNPDWFFMALYPLYDLAGAGPLWALGFGGSLLLCVLPWLPPLKRAKAPVVFLDQCNGCTRCFEDCPYSAITMQARTDGRPFEMEAVVNADLCTACGICVGSCPMSTPFRRGAALETGIDLPGLSLDTVHKKINAAITEAKSSAGDRPSLLVVGCDHGVPVGGYGGHGMAPVSLPCIGMLPPSFLDYALSGDRVDGVMLTGCAQCDCHHRLGIQWTEERLTGMRDPYLRKRVPRDRLDVYWAAANESAALGQEIDHFRERLEQQKQSADGEKQST